jgi:hypothetical protein
MLMRGELPTHASMPATTASTIGWIGAMTG